LAAFSATPLFAVGDLMSKTLPSAATRSRGISRETKAK
jgi:hypothetical protein